MIKKPIRSSAAFSNLSQSHNMATQHERLKKWIDTLDPEKIKEIALECIEELIVAETVGFYDTTEVPYWDTTGDALDGSER